MGAKSNVYTTGKTAQDSKPTTSLEWKCPHCSYTNEEDMSRAVVVDTAEARQTCIMCYNLHLLSSDGDSLVKLIIKEIQNIVTNSLFTVFD
jgi:hypothetical protein